MKRLLAVMMSGFLVYAVPAGAVVVGNPSGAMGKGEISLGLESERFEDVFDTDEVCSQRYLAKMSYGLTGFMDVFARIGSGALNVMPEGSAAGSGFTGDSRIALGGGVRAETARVSGLGGCRFFTTVQWLQFNSAGEFLRELRHKDYTWEERLETSYRWREIGAAFGVSRAFKKVAIHGGLAFTRITSPRSAVHLPTA